MEWLNRIFVLLRIIPFFPTHYGCIWLESLGIVPSEKQDFFESQESKCFMATGCAVFYVLLVTYEPAAPWGWLHAPPHQSWWALFTMAKYSQRALVCILQTINALFKLSACFSKGPVSTFMGFPDGAVVKKLPANADDARDMGSIPRSGRCPGEGNGNPLQYSCQGNSMDWGVWWATVHGVTKR